METQGDQDHAAGGGGHSFHAVRPEAFNYVWDNSIEPEFETESGEVVEFTVRDASDEQIRADSTSEDVAKLDFNHVNPVSGPFTSEAPNPATYWQLRSWSLGRGSGAGPRSFPASGSWPTSSPSRGSGSRG